MGDEDVVSDCLRGWLIDCFVTNCVCDFFKKLEEEKKVIENNACNRETGFSRGVFSNPRQYLGKQYCNFGNSALL